MIKKTFTVYFIVLILPMLVVSILLNVAYSLNVHDYIQMNWLFVVLLALVLDVGITWLQTQKDKKTKSE